MSTKTAKPPPAPVAALLSPFLWITERPDRFDVYSAGLIFLQLAYPYGWTAFYREGVQDDTWKPL